MKITLILVIVFSWLISAQINWFNVGSGANGEILDIYSDSSAIYFAGNFTQIDGVPANHIVKWNGTQWQAVNNNFNQVRCVALNGSDIYIGASTDDITGLFRWDGVNWDTIGIIPSGNISTIAFDDTNLYAGGFFNSISGVTAYSAARWDGNRWHKMGDDFQFEQIFSLRFFKNQLYAGGTFIRQAKNLFHIARWQDTSWISLNGGANLPVRSLYAYNDTLYIAGDFSQVGNFTGGSGIPANRIAIWDGVNWRAVGQGLSGYCNDVIVKQDIIFAVGNFSGSNPPFEVIYEWNGLNWNSMATSNGSFNKIAFFEQENSFYIGGNFSSVSTVGVANNLVKFIDSSLIVTTLQNDEIKGPTDFILYQNYPNPFNPSTKIKFAIPASSLNPFSKGEGTLVTLKVYDVLGNEIATLVNEEKPAGSYEVEFNAASSIKYSTSGIYLYQLKAGTYIKTKKMIMLR
ncbi:T9SS type A sorting domain-containing protein [Ignavibacterium sp.]|uniref:T9SS type A sorting domain-containing protein n=1 Tax=Ignavibacterium sp. TaxID=2651167 RepID=UPI00307F4103